MRNHGFGAISLAQAADSIASPRPHKAISLRDF
jgi:hypothetical protein